MRSLYMAAFLADSPISGTRMLALARASKPPAMQLVTRWTSSLLRPRRRVQSRAVSCPTLTLAYDLLNRTQHCSVSSSS